jgi:two-component system, cell cycle sensor histidine kinase and response regulator CckA
MARAPHGIAALDKDPDSSRARSPRERSAQTVEVLEVLARRFSHDLASPLSVITICASGILDRLPADHPLRDELEQILKAADQATDLARQLYEFGRRLRAELRPVE